MLACDIMTPSPAVVTSETPVRDAALIMNDLGVGFLPVVESRDTMRLRGVLTDRDIVIRCVANYRWHEGTVGACMTSARLVVVHPDTASGEILRLMEEHRLHRVPVVDRDGRLVGVISEGDLARHVGPGDPAAIEALVERISAPSVPMARIAPHPEIIVGGAPGIVS